MAKRPSILVVNDDGITAPGINALVECVEELGDVVVVAPDKPQSGMGHAITVSQLLRLKKVDLFGENIPAYQCTGTPADCVKLARDKVLHKMPDLVVSGINHGSNASVNVIYSGTVSAAMEGAMEGIPSIAFSLTDFSLEADFSVAKQYVHTIVKYALEKGIPGETLLNVNIPNLPAEEIKGIYPCRQALGYWKENFDRRQDPSGKEYYWLVGDFVLTDKGEDTDIWALKNGYIAMVPIHYDFTAHHAIRYLKEWRINESS